MNLKWRASLVASNAGDSVSIPGLGRSPGEGNGNPFQLSCLGNHTDSVASWARVHRGHKRVRRDIATKQQQFKVEQGIN